MTTVILLVRDPVQSTESKPKPELGVKKETKILNEK